MRPAHLLRTALVSVVVCVSGMVSSPASAGEDDGIGTINAHPERYNAEGFYKNPTCGYDFRIKNALASLSKQTPTGIKGSSKDWDMEIYATQDQSEWTLVGKSKAPGARERNGCYLARGNGSYAQQRWFVEYFK